MVSVFTRLSPHANESLPPNLLKIASSLLTILNIYLEVLIVDIFDPVDSSLVYVIGSSRVPVIGGDLHLYFFVWIERKGWKSHHFASRLSPGHISF